MMRIPTLAGRPRALAVLSCLAVLSTCVGRAPSPKEPGGAPAASRPVEVPEEIAAFYRERGYRPIWARGKALRPDAASLIGILREAGRHGLNPSHYLTPELKGAISVSASGDPVALARTDLALSRAFVSYVQDLHRPPALSKMIVVDPQLAPAPQSAASILDNVAKAPSLGQAVAAATRMNPVYEGLQRGLSASSGNLRLVQANLERARAIPANPGRRFILVDTAGARLWMFGEGRIAGSMRVIVGKPAMQTPEMAGLIRFAVLNPYWNVPPDLIRDKVAGHMLREGLGYVRRERLQVLSDWTESARILDPAKVNWRAVASGKELVRVRQLPGPGNMMGRVKFMFPNRLGIYLHDTPNKALFAQADRRLSSGCVRVEDAERLQRWLLDGAEVPPDGGRPELRVDLAEPVPVYITYLTALPTRHGIQFQPDSYGRDKAALATLSELRGGRFAQRS